MTSDIRWEEGPNVENTHSLLLQVRATGNRQEQTLTRILETVSTNFYQPYHTQVSVSTNHIIRKYFEVLL